MPPLNGGWDLEPWMAYTFSVLRPAAFLVALYVDRALFRRLPALVATLVYPAVYGVSTPLWDHVFRTEPPKKS